MKIKINRYILKKKFSFNLIKKILIQKIDLKL